MGRTGQPTVYLGVASVLVVAAGVGVAASRGAGPVSKAPTTLAQAHDVRVTSLAGATTAARAGQQVRAGDLIRTGHHGSAQLVTRGRTVYVGPDAAVAVVNGAHQQLRHGRAVVDAQHGPGLQVDLAGDTLDVPDGSAVEASREVTVVVGALAGPSVVTNSSARRLTIPRLSQAAINGDSLPATTTPLHLNDGAIESRVVPTLVSDDRALKDLAHGIDDSGPSTAQVVEAAWHGTPAGRPGSLSQGDFVLPMAIADATAPAGGTVQARYDHVVTWRRAGGSWGVVLGLLSGHAGAVGSALDSLEHAQPAGQIGSGLSLQALARGPLPGAPAGNPGGNGAPNPGPSSSPPATSPPTGPGPGGHDGGPPAPKPTKSPVQRTVGTVKKVVHKVQGLLPKLPKIPLPTKSSHGLLGGVLGQ